MHDSGGALRWRCPANAPMPGGDARVNSSGTHGDGAAVRDDACALFTGRECRADGGPGMETVWYAVRVRGRTCDVATAASQEGLDVAVDPVRTVLRGRLPDQAALFGILTRVRLLGLELIEVRRGPQSNRRRLPT